MHAVRASRLAWMSVRMAVRICAALTTPLPVRLQAVLVSKLRASGLLFRVLGLAEEIVGLEAQPQDGLVVRIAGPGDALVGLELSHRRGGRRVDLALLRLAQVEVALVGERVLQ